ncbi:MAG TPA: LD-carboxypeptidase [Caulobacteraceae bacterium]|jgi:muramoyltetrapeptide carboxypeptidase
MGERRFRIGVVAPGGRIAEEIAERTAAAAAQALGEDAPEIWFHPQCFHAWGHFAGEDEARAAAFLDVANDPGFDALWFARGGYGACRIAEGVIARLEAPARAKAYLGYSDAGFMLAGLYRAGAGRLAHGPMPCDVAREGGSDAIARALNWLLRGDGASLEPLAASGVKSAAFNITVLSQMLGTPLQPDLSGHVLMLEEVGEYMYRIDRSLFHITSNPAIREAAGIALGRCGAVPENDPDFIRTEEEVARYWCERSGIPYLGRADIGHDAGNKVVPFG